MVSPRLKAAAVIATCFFAAACQTTDSTSPIVESAVSARSNSSSEIDPVTGSPFVSSALRSSARADETFAFVGANASSASVTGTTVLTFDDLIDGGAHSVAAHGPYHGFTFSANIWHYDQASYGQAHSGVVRILNAFGAPNQSVSLLAPTNFVGVWASEPHGNGSKLIMQGYNGATLVGTTTSGVLTSTAVFVAANFAGPVTKVVFNTHRTILGGGGDWYVLDDLEFGDPVPVDNSAPIVAPTVTGTLGANGWYTSDINVSWSVTDGESPITSPACTASTVTTDTNGVTFSCTATSQGGTTTESVTVMRDATVPTVTPVITGTLVNSWYTSDVSVSWTVASGLSGSTSTCVVNSQTTDTNNVSFSCSATSGAGLTGTGSTSFKRDATSPTIGYTGNAGSYTIDQNIAIVCSAGDVLSGLASTNCANVNVSASSLSLGVHTYSASATDNAGNTSSATTSFTVKATTASLCAMTRLFVTGQGEAGVENSLCTKLEKGNYGPYINEVQAQSGKKISAANAALLILWAQSL